MDHKFFFPVSILGFAISTLGFAESGASRLACSASEQVVALVADTAITGAQLESLARDKLMRLRTQEYQIKRMVLEDVIARLLLEKEASHRRISQERLTELEIRKKVAPVTLGEKKAAYESTKERLSDISEEAALEKIELGLRRQRESERQKEFVRELRGKTQVRMFLEAPRVALDSIDGGGIGAGVLPVTIVEFSDFECPYCAQVNPTLKRLEAKYGNKFRTIFRNFPPESHKQAPLAAEAAGCAADQGKYREMRDKLFANQQKLEMPFLKQYAEEIGLKSEAFSECLDSRRHTAEWKAEVERGSRYGVRGTPTFFVNGRPIVGAATYEHFSKVIDEELERAGESDAVQRVSTNHN